MENSEVSLAPSGRGSPRSAAGAADLFDPRLDLRAQHGQAHGSGAEERVVEAAQIEAGAEARLRVGAKAADFELAELVGQRLRGPGDVAIDLVDDVLARERGVLLHEG